MRFVWAIVFLPVAPLFSQSYPAPTPVYSKTFGGSSGGDAATALAVDPSGNVAIIGNTGSPDFPVTNAYIASVPTPPLIAVSQNGWTYPNLGGAVDVLATASTKDGSVVYASSDSGIFRSADGGISWTRQLPGLAGVNSIAVDGANSSTVYAVISGYLSNASSGAFKSTDAGQTWTAISPLQYLPFLFIATLQCPAQLSGVIYATDNGFYRSRDSGVTWTTIGPHNYNVFSFALAASDPNVVYTVASDGYVYRSADGGDTWATPGGMFPAYPNANGSSYAYGLAVDPQDENTVWALILDGNLYKSTDGGATFALVLSDPADQPSLFLSVSPSGQNIIVSSRGGSNAHAIVSYDRGITWTRVATPGTINAVLAGQNSFFIDTDVYSLGFLTKWSADGSHMIFSTFLPTQPQLVATDADGNTYVAGQSLMKFDPVGNLLFSQSLGTMSPTAMTVGSSIVIAASPEDGVPACSSAPGAAPLILKFDLHGNQIFSQPIPQVCGTAVSIMLDNSGAIYLAGDTYSITLATTPTAIQPLPNLGAPFSNGFIAVLSPQADQVAYLSYLQGAESIALDNSGNVYVAGAAINPVAFTPTSTFTGAVCGANTEVAFVVKLSLSSPKPLWFTEIGGGCQQPISPTQVAIDANGFVWVGGSTSSGLFPTLAPFEVQGTDQGFLAQLTGDTGTVQFSSYAPSHFALGPQQTLYMAGAFPLPKVDTQIGPPTSTSAAIEKIDLSTTQSAVIDSINAIQPSADFQTQFLGIAPGEEIRIAGRGLGPAATLTAQIEAGSVATSLGGIEVLFNGFPAPLIGVQASAIACVTPFELSGASVANVQIVQNGIATPGVAVGVWPVAYVPTILTVANQNGTINSQSNPAHPGQTVTIYVTGFGDTTPSVPDGSIYQAPLPVPLYNITSNQTVTYAGPAPGAVAGIWQVNIALGSSAASGPNPLQVYLGSSYVIGSYVPGAAVVSVWVAP